MFCADPYLVRYKLNSVVCTIWEFLKIIVFLHLNIAYWAVWIFHFTLQNRLKIHIYSVCFILLCTCAAAFIGCFVVTVKSDTG